MDEKERERLKDNIHRLDRKGAVYEFHMAGYLQQLHDLHAKAGSGTWLEDMTELGIRKDRAYRLMALRKAVLTRLKKGDQDVWPVRLSQKAKDWWTEVEDQQAIDRQLETKKADQQSEAVLKLIQKIKQEENDKRKERQASNGTTHHFTIHFSAAKERQQFQQALEQLGDHKEEVIVKAVKEAAKNATYLSQRKAA